MEHFAKKYISQLPIFSHIEQNELLPILKNCVVKEFKSGQYIFRYGEYGEDCGIILSGSAHVDLPQKGTESDPKKIILPQGEIFGEIAALSRYARTANVIALKPTKVLIIPRAVLMELFDKFPSVKNKIDKLYRQRVLTSQLLTVPVFAGVPAELLQDLANKSSIHHYHKGDIVYHQGDEAEDLYLVRYGCVKVTETGNEGKERVLAYLKGGHYFGEHALMKEGERRTVTVTATTRTELIRIVREDFLNLIESFPRLKTILQKTAEKTKERYLQIREDEWLERTLSTFIDSEVIQAKRTLFIDTSKCIHCDRCIKACAVMHNNQSRLVRKGVKLSNLFLIPTSCRHCEDPTCMIRCPTGTITRDFSGEIYIKDTCIGCGSCAKNCPYGNIFIVDLPEMTDGGQQSFASLLKRKKGGDRQENPGVSSMKKPLKRKKIRKHAAICDMCREYSFLGCVYNCPRGAARSGDLAEFFVHFTPF